MSGAGFTVGPSVSAERGTGKGMFMDPPQGEAAGLRLALFSRLLRAICCLSVGLSGSGPRVAGFEAGFRFVFSGNSVTSAFSSRGLDL